MEEGGGEVPNQQVMFGGSGGHSVSSAKIKLAIGGGIFLFVIVLTAVIIVDSVHTIEERPLEEEPFQSPFIEEG